MKQVFFILLLVFCANNSFSQKENPWSLEIGGSSYDYILSKDRLDEYSNKFNKEFYLLPSKQFSWIKLTSGIMFSTKSIKYNNPSVNMSNNTFYTIYRADFDINYIKLPILVSFGYNYKNVRFSFNGGFIFDKILNYRVGLNYRNDGYSYKDYKVDDIGLSLRGGVSLSTEIFKNVNLNIKSFVDNKVVRDNISDLYNYKWGTVDDYDYYYSQIPAAKTSRRIIPGGLLSYGLSIGIEYVFK